MIYSTVKVEMGCEKSFAGDLKREIAVVSPRYNPKRAWRGNLASLPDVCMRDSYFHSAYECNYAAQTIHHRSKGM